MDASAWDQRYTDSDLLWSAEPNRFVATELADLTPGRAVDLAAGEGRNAIWLAGRGWRATAVDFSPIAIDKGRRLAEAAGVDVEWVVADLLDHVPEPAGFELVLVAYLQLPPEQLGAVLDRAARAVAPGGVLLVVGHDATNLSDGVGGPQSPDLLYTPEAIAARLAGLRVDRAERVRRPVPGADREAIDTLVRAHRPAP
ncbi:class I SAM-dependent methyltransferase [Plantactinospora soyae]|uniref:SAM-dependent methyltransferase n=1 Tax=Plantactinospora soyae TaxID=1544732 RepID=A0A927MBG7_9ACTN|nr:class I SAM-dependent methyltransferase [Plantactinospora soyae]MBE1491389.1 SAM-dependent methyltransferase [Plantactinospora soyae]